MARGLWCTWLCVWNYTRVHVYGMYIHICVQGFQHCLIVQVTGCALVSMGK